MAAVQNMTYASPAADAKFAEILGAGPLADILAQLPEVSALSIAITVLLVLVAYDQCECFWQSNVRAILMHSF